MTISVKRFSSQPKPFILAISLIYVALLGLIDAAFDPELSFLVLYLAPVLFAAWFAGRNASFVVCFGCFLVWLLDELRHAYVYSHAVIPYWNLAGNLTIFLGFSYAVVELHGSVERRRVAERERYEREIRIAQEVQALLFPSVLPRLKTLEYTAVCRPARGVAGDYYDFFRVNGGKVGFVVADVSGKGISAALLMARLQGLMRSHASLYGTRVADFIAELNRTMFLGPGSSRYVTLFYGVYDDATGELVYVNAGHNPPFLWRAGDRSLTVLSSGGTVVGLLPDRSYVQDSTVLYPGDILVLFTDGVTETENPMGGFFGEDGLTVILRGHNVLPPSELQKLILDELDRFRQTAPLQDDLTLVVAKSV